MYLTGGFPKEALPDFRRANELTPSAAEYVLWLDIAEHRNNLPSDVAQAAQKINPKIWSAPLVKLYLGQLTPAAIFATIDKTNQSQVCQANFFVGEWQIMQGAKEEARRLLQLAGYCTWLNVAAELKALEATP